MCQHISNLDKMQKGKLSDLVMKYEIIIDKRGHLKGDEVSIKINPGTKLFLAKPYPGPSIN